MQQSPTMMVYRFMNMSKKLLLLVAGITGLSCCASTDGAARDREPEEYYCTNRADVKDMFEAGEFRH
jgi:hypothetical protein